MYIHGEWPATRANPVYGGFDLSVGVCMCAYVHVIALMKLEVLAALIVSC